MDVFALHEGAAAAFQIVDAANEYIAETAPWALAKDPANADRLSGVLFDVAEAIRVAAVLLLPVMPSSSAEILKRVGDPTPADQLRLDRDARWRGEGDREVTKGPALWPRAEAGGGPGPPPPQTVQPALPGVGSQGGPMGEGGQARLTKEKVLEDKPGEAAAAAPAAPAGDSKIAIDDFMKTELRVAKVLEAEAVPKSKKLIRMQIDVGEGAPRQIVAGIAEVYRPEDLVGRSIVVVANLKPAKLMGLESNGMVLAASPEGGAPTLLSVADGIPPGTRVR
jgi:methionyl-tRNA synthetase